MELNSTNKELAISDSIAEKLKETNLGKYDIYFLYRNQYISERVANACSFTGLYDAQSIFDFMMSHGNDELLALHLWDERVLAVLYKLLNNFSDEQFMQVINNRYDRKFKINYSRIEQERNYYKWRGLIKDASNNIDSALEIANTDIETFISVVDISIRSNNIINTLNFKTVKDLIVYFKNNPDGFRMIRNCGAKSNEEIKMLCEEYKAILNI